MSNADSKVGIKVMWRNVFGKRIVGTVVDYDPAFRLYHVVAPGLVKGIKQAHEVTEVSANMGEDFR